jgi:phosphoinositide-3-kinase, regulatory subunit 4
MGQGYSLSAVSAGSAGIDVPELSDLSFEQTLGNARFMKALRARHRDGLVVVKVVVKPFGSMDLKEYVRRITRKLISLFLPYLSVQRGKTH